MSDRYGSETYNIDHKGRVSVPVALRRASGRRASLQVVLTRGFEGCIVMYTLEQWARFEAMRDRILALHPYDVPEVLALRVEAGSERYLAWVAGEVG